MLYNENETFYIETSIPASMYKKAKKLKCETKYNPQKNYDT